MNNLSDKPSLPSIKDLLEGGPGLIDYSNYQHEQPYQQEQPNRYKSHLLRHRRHVSEHITTATTVLPPISVPEHRIQTNNETLPIKMQSLSLEEEQDNPTSVSRARTHSRSYSDFTHPYPRNNHTEPVNTIILPIDDINTSQTKEQESPPPPPPPSSPQDTKYICPYCNKGFTRPSSLRTHTYSHTGEKPFICTEPCCGRKFSVQSNLRRHLRVHRLSKPSPLFLPKNIK